MQIIRDEERKVQIGLPDVITAEHWRRYYVEREKYNLPGPFPAQFVASYMAALALLEEGHYEDGNGRTVTFKEAGLEVPAYIMIWVATRGQEVLNAALEVPKAS